MEKKFNWSKFWWRILQVLIVIIFNGATIFFIVSNMIEIGDGEASWWDGLTVKYVAKKVGMEDLYHWYNKMLVYLFMILGVIVSYLFIKFLYKNNREIKVMEKQAKLENDKQNKALEKIEKIMRGK